jgi:tetratricopeptide (TPR) repeat protein
MKPRLWAWGLAYGLLGAGLCFVPLFNVLGFELAFVAGLVSAFAGAHLGSAATGLRRAGATRSDGEAADARPLSTLLRHGGGVWLRVLLLSLLPLGLVALNALRVKTCAPLDGLAWYAMLVAPSAFAGVAAGVVAALLVGGTSRRRRRAATLLALAVPVTSIVWGVVRFYTAPPIFGHDPFAGYFPGSLYDEDLALSAAVLWARLYHVLGALAALALAALCLDGRDLRLRRPRRGRGAAGALVVVAGGLALALFVRAPALGFRLDADDVAARLGATRESAHFILHYSPTGPFAADIDRHLADHELRWHQLERRFGQAPAGKVRAYLFDSPAQKKALMGASHTFIAKPWRREIYLHAIGWPHPVLMHELAHVFAGSFGDPIFGVARRGLHLDVGLVEGVAVAASFGGGHLTPHQSARALKDLGRLPPLASLFGPRFLGNNAAAAYDVAGSFCRYLLDQYGPHPLRAVYAAGGAPEAYRAAYGKPFAELTAEWMRFLDGVKVPEAELGVMRDRLLRPSIFRRPCPHELAARREEAQRAEEAGDQARARALRDSICSDDPDEPQHLADWMEAAARARKDAEAEALAGRLIAHPKVSPAQRARVHILLGELAFRNGEPAAARRAFAAAEALPLDEGSARLTTVRRLILDEPDGPLRRALAALLLPDQARDAAVDLWQSGELVRLAPERALSHYLHAKQLAQHNQPAAAAAAAARALGEEPEMRPLPDHRFTVEALRMLGRARFAAGDLPGARAAFARLAAEPDPRLQLEAEDWLDRIAFAGKAR